LTYLKGSGLPHRYKHQQNQWAIVREYIEQRERDFYLERCTLEVNEVILIIERMYKDVRSGMEASMPDDSMAQGKRGKEREGNNQPPPSPTYASKQKDEIV
jgi:SMODS and SLOG-associating 2TM effector domain